MCLRPLINEESSIMMRSNELMEHCPLEIDLPCTETCGKTVDEIYENNNGTEELIWKHMMFEDICNPCFHKTKEDLKGFRVGSSFQK